MTGQWYRSNMHRGIWRPSKWLKRPISYHWNKEVSTKKRLPIGKRYNWAHKKKNKWMAAVEGELLPKLWWIYESRKLHWRLAARIDFLSGGRRNCGRSVSLGSTWTLACAFLKCVRNVIRLPPFETWRIHPSASHLGGLLTSTAIISSFLTRKLTRRTERILPVRAVIQYTINIACSAQARSVHTAPLFVLHCTKENVEFRSII